MTPIAEVIILKGHKNRPFNSLLYTACMNTASPGLGMCLGDDSPDVLRSCNFYYNDACVVTCPFNLVAGANFDCGECKI